MSKTLVIIEGFGKVKKLESILGKNYKVMATGGHIIDLKEKEMSVDIKNNFEPEYQIIPKSEKSKQFKSKDQIVKDLKKEVKLSSDVLLATDLDREGEMIAWSVAHMLGLKDPKRIGYTEITKTQVLNAVKNPRKIDMNLVDAQKARRILDRIVGFEISPILWKTIKGSMSAGRVQSVVVKIIIDRENEIKDFFDKDAENYFKFNGKFVDANKNEYKGILYQSKDPKRRTTKKDKNDETEETNGNGNGNIAKIKTENEARKIMSELTKSTFKVSEVFEKESIRNPSPPFITSTLQQDASLKLGFSVKKTMASAQKLYEAGYITYMRTDSVTLSNDAQNNIKKYIIEEFGKEYHRHMDYKNKSKNSQEAHEAIRPTDVFTTELNIKDKIGNDEVRLYNLIWKRTVASQMSPAKFNTINIVINISKLPAYYFLSQFEELLFDGFMKVYNIKNKEKDDTESETSNETKCKPKIGTILKPENITAVQDYEKPPTRYNEASLVKKMEALGIGRPATYAANVNTVQEREYVEVKNCEGVKKISLTMSWNGNKEGDIKETKKEVLLGKDKNKLVPTFMGCQVNDFLVNNFPEIMDYQFTSNMETKFDEIAEGEIKWVNVMKEFYKDFHPTVEKLVDTIKDSPNTFVDKNLKVLGKHPESGMEISATIGKYGPMIKMETKVKSKPIIKKIVDPYKFKTITLNDALEILEAASEYPKILGTHNKKPVQLCKGQFGLYLKYDDKNISFAKNEEFKDKEDLTLEDAIKLIDAVKKNVLWEETKNKINYSVREGQYGKYISVLNLTKKNNKPFYVPLPEGTNVNDMTIDKVTEIIENNKNKQKKYKKSDKDKEKSKSPNKKTKK